MALVNTISARPSNLRGSYVWYLPAAKEDATHQDYSDVVPKVNSILREYY